MFIGFESSFEQLIEILEPNSQTNTQTNRTPQRKSSAYPIPKFEHIFWIYTKLFHRQNIGRNGYKMFGNIFGCRSEEHTSELQSRGHLVCRLLLEKKKRITKYVIYCTS